jgi:hypothetical protein
MADLRPSVTFTIPSGKEGAQQKALRLLLEGRVRVRLVHRGRVRVEVRGDTGQIYNVMFTNGGWHCSCPMLAPGCSHMRAAWTVIASEEP